jgi:hypothetical protein
MVQIANLGGRLAPVMACAARKRAFGRASPGPLPTDRREQRDREQIQHLLCKARGELRNALLEADQ